MSILFWCLLTALKLHPSPFPFSCTSGQANKNPGCSLLWCNWEFQTIQAPGCALDPSLQPHPLTTTKIQASDLSLFSQDIFRPALEACFVFLIKPHYVSNKPFSILLVCKWHHQSQHLKQILDGDGSILNFQSSHNQWLVYRQNSTQDMWKWNCREWLTYGDLAPLHIFL